MNWKQALSTNWKTSLAGLCAFLSSVPGFINALMAWGNKQPVNWREILVSVALAAIGAGLAAAKDGTTHSTVAQTQAATAVVINDPAAPGLVRAADAQVAAKK